MNEQQLEQQARFTPGFLKETVGANPEKLDLAKDAAKVDDMAESVR